MSEMLKSVLRGLAVGVGFTVIICFVIGAAELFVDIPEDILGLISVLILALAAYTASYTSTQLYRSKGLVQGIICGSGLFLLTFALSAVCGQLVFSEVIVVKLIACIAMGAFGGVKGINTKKTKLRH